MHADERSKGTLNNTACRRSGIDSLTPVRSELPTLRMIVRLIDSLNASILTIGEKVSPRELRGNALDVQGRANAALEGRAVSAAVGPS